MTYTSLEERSSSWTACSPCRPTLHQVPVMSSLRRFASLAALVNVVAACEGAPFDPSTLPPELTRRDAKLTTLNGSGLLGNIQISGYEKPLALVTAAFTFSGVGRNEPGARYPVHIHAGLTCSGVNVPISHDLGAWASSILPSNAATGIPTIIDFSATVPSEHLLAGYYLDVHATNDPTGAPLGCTLFEWQT